MLTLEDPVERLRDACTRNNAEWLRAIGCSVEANSSWLRVWHDELPEFRALVVLSDAPPANPHRITKWVLAAATEGLAVYLDGVANSSWHATLGKHGFSATGRSYVRALDASEVASPHQRLQMVAVDASGIISWTDLYCGIFERPAVLAESELRRTAAAFANDSIRHYLFRSDIDAIGLCQLCLNNGVAGLYSVGFLPSARSYSILLAATRLVREEVVNHGLGLLYFERSRPGSGSRQAAEGSNMRRVLRSFQVWTLKRPGI